MAKKKLPHRKTTSKSHRAGDSIVIHGASIEPAHSQGDAMRGAHGSKYSQVNLDTLERNVDEFISKLGKILLKLPTEVGVFELDEITLSAEVSAKGTLSLLGTGGEASGKGGLNFVFKRPK